MADTPHQMPRCAIVYGSLRSGTTMLRLMLDGHAQMACSGEADFLFDHLHRAGGSWRYDRDAMERDFMYIENPLRISADLDGEAALADMIHQISGGDGVAIIMLHRHMERVAELLPNVPVIHLNRDPRDIAKSSIGMGWAGNVFFGCDHWVETQEGWERYVASHPSNPVLEMRYEDLVAAPVAELTRLCEFLGLSYEDGLLAYPAHSTYSEPDATLANQWKRKLSQEELGLIEARLGSLLTSSGYAPSGAPMAQLGGLRMLGLKLQNRLAIWRVLISRYGVLAPVSRGLGRRLGIAALRDFGTTRINALHRNFIK